MPGHGRHHRPGPKICIDPRLNEIDLGVWDGKSFDHIKKPSL